MYKYRLMLGATLLGLLTATHSFADAVDPMEDIDDDMRAVLNAQASLGPIPVETLTAQEARLQPSAGDGAALVMKGEGKHTHMHGVGTQDLAMPNGVKLRLYFPSNVDSKKALPVVVYYHGGGFVIGSIDGYDATPRETARHTKSIVVSVGYRQAPEFKFPTAHDDAFDAYKWVVENAASFGGDPQRIAVMGESAGGNLAINTAIAARDAQIQMPVYEVLVYPVAGVDMNTKSYMENATAKPLNKAMMGWFFRQYARNFEDLQDPRMDIVGKADLHGLPPTTVITDDIDPLKSDGHILATELKAAGVKTHVENYEGVTHEFFGMGSVVSAARDAEGEVNSDLEDAFENCSGQ